MQEELVEEFEKILKLLHVTFETILPIFMTTRAHPGMEIHFMPRIKSILMVIFGCSSFMATAQAEKLPVVASLYPQCPLALQLEGQSYALESEHLYSGPVEDRATLKPEPIPGEKGVEPSFWEYRGASAENPFYLKCLYKDTAHHLVLNLHGAWRCTATRTDVRMKCE